MKNLLITFLFTLTTAIAVQSFATPEEWNQMKELCKAGAINKQDRAHRPKVNCTYTEEGGHYTELTTKTLVIDKNIVDPTISNFIATYSTDKSKSDRYDYDESYVNGVDNSKAPDSKLVRNCTNYKYTKHKNFVYQKADTCRLMKDQPNSRAFCDFIYNEVFTQAERDLVTKTIPNSKAEQKVCLDGKGDK